MAINVSVANQQAAEIAAKISDLRDSRTKLHTYRAELDASWQGREVGLFDQAIDQAIRKIDILIGEMTAISDDVRKAASDIDREEKAAAAAAAQRAAQQQRAAEARAEYNRCCDVLDQISEERKEIVRMMSNTKSKNTMAALNVKLMEIDERMAQAQNACEQCRMAVDAAGR